MTTDAVNTQGALVYPFPEFNVFLGPEDGSVPGASETFDDVQCTRVVQSAGGSKLDYADLTWHSTGYLQNRTQPANFARMVEVWLDAGANGERLHLGDYVSESASVQQDGEALTAQSQVRGYHFGEPVKFYDVWSALGVDSFQTIDDDVVFNPTIDDKTIFNRSDLERTAGGYVWTHPELADGTIGATWQGQTRNEWTLGQAVKAVCWLLNADQEFILNPAIFPTGSPDLRNVRVPLGTRLPLALDLLLIPLGYNWYLDYTQDKPQITIFTIGDGEEKELFFQAPGSTLNLAGANLLGIPLNVGLSNVNQFATDNSIADSINQVTVLGEFEEAECTFPLFPAWSSAHDGITESDLAKDGADYVGHETVWRLWIANEAGDIDPAVVRLGQTPVVPDLTTIFDKYIPHRRQLGEPLTYIAGTPAAATQIKQRRPHVVEWSDDSGVTWKPEESSWTIKLCPDQIGVMFDAKEVPTELYAAGSSGRVRITGTVFGDSRIQSTAYQEDFAVNGRVVDQVIARPDKFQYRFRNTAGSWMSVLTGDADTKDDSTAIEDFAEKLRDKNQYADLSCEFRLPGHHLHYKIGDLITKINGREISLNAAPANAPENRYVQITERRFEMTPGGGPSTVLIVDRGLAELRDTVNRPARQPQHGQGFFGDNAPTSGWVNTSSSVVAR